MKLKKPLTYISLFSSVGVGCYGFKSEDFFCVATIAFSIPNTKIVA